MQEQFFNSVISSRRSRIITLGEYGQFIITCFRSLQL